MTRDELIAQARALADEHLTQALEGGEDGVLAALETIYGHGFADEQFGDVDGLIGHVYRVDRWVVVTDTYGNHDVQIYADDETARQVCGAMMVVEEGSARVDEPSRGPICGHPYALDEGVAECRLEPDHVGPHSYREDRS